MVIHNFSELLINVAYDLNKNNATLELNFMEMGEFIDKYLILHLDKDILKRIIRNKDKVWIKFQRNNNGWIQKKTSILLFWKWIWYQYN